MEISIVAEGIRFPEGPVVLPDGAVALVETEAGRVSRVDASGTLTVIAETGGGPNGIAIGPDGALYVCNNGGCTWHNEPGLHRPAGISDDWNGGSIQRIDPVTGAVTTLYTECGGNRLSGPNDIVFDRHGGFYFTDTGRAHSRARDDGGLYYALPDGSRIVEVAYPILTANGVGLSPDETVVYVAETETSRLWAFDIVSPGVVRKYPFPSHHGGRLVCGLPGYQRFDSLAVAASGNISVATLVTGFVHTISPSGELVHSLDTGDKFTTNICFWGADMRTAYITLSGTKRLGRTQWFEPGLKLNFQR